MLAIVLVLFVASASAAYGQTVKIGTATALTGLGALIAKAGVVGMEIAVEDLNKKGGLLGRKVELIVRDSKLRPEIGARELKELILNDKIELAIGPVSSGVGLAMSEVAKEHKVPICMHDGRARPPLHLQARAEQRPCLRDRQGRHLRRRDHRRDPPQ